MAELDRLKPGQSLAEVPSGPGAAERDRWLVLDEFVATAGEDRWTVGEARAILLAAVGREPSDAAAFWKHGAADCGTARADRIGRGVGEASRSKEGGGRRGV